MPESNTFGPENQDDIEDSLAPKKRRGGSALSRYLFQNRQREAAMQQDNSIELDDDDDESEEKPKRLRKLFGRIFPKIVDKVDISDTKKTRQTEFQAWFTRSEAVPVQLPSTEFDGANTVTSGEVNSTPDQSNDSDNEEDEIDLQQTATKTAQIYRAQATLPTPATQNQVSAPNSNAFPNQPAGPNFIPPVPPSPGNPNIPNGPNMPSTGNPNYNVQPPTPNISSVTPNTMSNASVERERIIEKRGSVLPYVLIGAEYLARKSADKKLEKRVNEKLTTTNNEVNRSAVLQQELATVVRQNREQLNALKESRATVERRGAVVPEARLSSMRPELKPQSERLQHKPERIEWETKQQERAETVPNKIFEQVARAAEQDVPVERVFERSHEVKDDDSMPVLGAASVGSVMASNKQSGNSVIAALQQPAPRATQTPKQTQSSTSVGDDMYQQAMKAGFLVGTITIILGSIAYLMIK